MERVYFKSTLRQNGSKNEFLHVCTRQQLNIYNIVILNINFHGLVHKCDQHQGVTRCLNGKTTSSQIHLIK